MIDMKNDRLKHILSKTIKANKGCMEYTGCIQANGYSRITVNSETDYGHRHVYRLAKGQIDDGLDVRHTCDNTKCINPNHLELGTRKENMRDAVSRGRQARGLMLPQTKIYGVRRTEIVRLAILGKPYKEIGEIYGISRQAAGLIALKAGVRRNGISK